MDWIIWIYAFSALASALAAVLAWTAKLWWSKEYGAAKDEIIKAKEAQIELLKNEIQNLRELTPMKIREYFLSVKTQLEEYNAALQQQLDNAQKEIEVKDKEIEAYGRNSNIAIDEMSKLKSEKLSLENKVAFLESQIANVREEANILESSPNLPRNDPGNNKTLSFVTSLLVSYIKPATHFPNSIAWVVAPTLLKEDEAEAISALSRLTSLDENNAKIIVEEVRRKIFRDELLRTDRGESN